jgi:membrane-associated protease RseP (regulator of RpoE activity)
MNEPIPAAPPTLFQEVSANQAQLFAEQARRVVADDLAVDSVQVGREQRSEGVVILRGRLRKPSEQVFARWLEEFRRIGCTPVLRRDGEGEREQVLLRIFAGVVQPPADRPWINLLLLVITAFSCMMAGINYGENIQVNTWFDLLRPSTILQGLPFAAALLGILLAHEFGHYLAARYHNLAVSLPFFIPLPIPFAFSPGTMGAFIRLKALLPDRRKLFDVGVAGPLAGLVVAIPLLFIGLATCEVKAPPAGGSYLIEGNSLLYLLAKWLVHGKILPNPITGEDVFINSFTAAAWFGLYVTALNLLPVGQLDGGHTVFAMFGARARRINWFALGGMALLGVLGIEPLPSRFPVLQQVGFNGWFLWLLLISVIVGPYHPPALDDVTRLDRRRRWLGWLVIVIFILTFVPVPVRFV